jgi:endonuclease G
VDKLERAARLKKMLAQIAPGNSLELLPVPKVPPTPSGGLESLAPTFDPNAALQAGLEKLAQDRHADITSGEMFGLEAIVMRENRPVAFVRKGTYDDLVDPWRKLNDAAVKDRLNPLLPLIGRIELPPPSPIPYGGTGFIVGDGLMATNRHVARLFSEGLGMTIRYHSGDAGINFGREVDSPDDGFDADLAVTGVLMIHPFWDMALLNVAGLPTGGKLPLSIKSPEALVGKDIVVVGYPARDDRSDLAVQDSIFGGRYSVKRLQPGVVRERVKIPSFESVVNAMAHDASTLGGNSGSAVIDIETGSVVGLHFAGEYLKANYAVPMYELARDDRVARNLNFKETIARTDEWDSAWKRTEGQESAAAPAPPPAQSTVLQSPQPARAEVKTRAGEATWTIPLQISVSIGQPAGQASMSPPPAPSSALVRAAPREPFTAEGNMANGSSILRRAGFDLDTAVFLATMSSLAYSAPAVIDGAAKTAGFASSSFFDAGNVQGYWCAGPDVALLAFRGTSNPGQWLRDVRFLPASHPWGHVHEGFLQGVASVEAGLLAFDGVAQTAAHVWVTGHSLGGALALVAAARLKIKTGQAPLIHSYGQPAVGLNDFAERFNVEMPGCLWRFVNQSDIVTRVPPGPLYRHVGTVKRIVRPGVLESLRRSITEAPVGATAEHEVAASQVISGGPALEAAVAAKGAGVVNPLLTDLDPMQLNDTEFARLQLALNAGGRPGLESQALEGTFSWFADHSISEYIRLLSDIRSGIR